MSKNKNIIDVTYAAGWLRCRAATIDETSGNMEIVAGVELRVRLSDIITYCADMPGVIQLSLREHEENTNIIGSLATLDKIMERNALKEVT
jgi:hypothetical protein